MARQLKNLVISEVSSVDRGAGRGVKVMLMKRDLSDNVFEIDFAALRKALGNGEGLDDLVAGLRVEVGKIEKDAAITDKRAAVQKCLDVFNEAVGKLSPEDQERIATVTPEQIAKMVSDAVTKGIAEATKGDKDRIAKLEFERDWLAMPAAYQEFAKAMSEEDKKKFMAKKPDEKEADVADAKKRAAGIGADPIVKALQADNEDMKKRLAAADERDAITTFEKKAKDLGLPATHGEVMRKAYSGDKVAIETHEKMLKSLAECARVGKVFEEFGDNRNTGGTTAYAQLVAKAAELRKTDSKLTPEQAFVKVYEDPANVELAKQHRVEEGQRIAKVNPLAA